MLNGEQEIEWKHKMNQARGFETIDLVIRRAQLVNVFSGEIHETDIGIHNGYFVGLGQFHQAKKEVNLEGKRFVVPGLIDSHVHLESSHLCPEDFCSQLLAHGVTTAVFDPHEIANVLGKVGIQYILDAVDSLPFNAFITLPSCVPATRLETSGASLSAKDLAEFVIHPRVIGLGEVMDYPGVLNAKPSILEKLELPLTFKDGHAPGISPQDLNAYYQAGIHTDHECSSTEEALERLRRGFYVMMREGSAAKNLLDLLPVINDFNSSQCLLVTDDRSAFNLLNQGSIDHLIRMAIQSGVAPIRAIQMGTLNAARALGLSQLGAVAPGYQADFTILNNLEQFVIEEVYWKGIRQSFNGVAPTFVHHKSPGLLNTVRLGSWSREKLELYVKKPMKYLETKDQLVKEENISKVKIRVIKVLPRSLTTLSEIRELSVRNGLVEADTHQDIAKLVVIERHHESGRTGIGFVEGIGLTRGAMASTVAHDSHNLVAVGMSDAEMELAIRTCEAMGGGLVVVDGETILGSLPLPIAGLMTKKPPVEVAQKLEELHEKACSLGVSEDIDAFMTLAFLSLPVIPELKLTDFGLIDVNEQKVVSTIVESI